MNTKVCRIDELTVKDSALLDEVVQDLRLFHKSLQNESLIKIYILEFLSELRDDLKVIIESEYVDRDYRDSYYTYFSTKLLRYSRFCVRMSFFDSALPEDVSPGDKDIINQNYLGFVVLRPLVKCIGRNVISPKAKKGEAARALICKTKVNATCMGVKLSAEGFPHSSQDGETMTCAQTTIWSLLEYFGNRYVEYVPTLPSEIKEVLTPFSYERQLPSSGLSFEQISVALRELGFGTKVYMAPTLPDNPQKEDINAYNHAASLFKEILYCYLESGIPLALCLQNKCLGHAVVAIGRSDTPKSDVINGQTELDGGKICYMWNLATNKIVLNDDNFPCYQVVGYDNPTDNYVKRGNVSWDGMKINYFIAPLYSKVYMDAGVAIAASRYIANDIIKVPEKSAMRTFLTSSRTYRDYLASNPQLNRTQKEALLSFSFPRFIWITEISSVSNFQNDMTENTIVIDATAGKSIKNISSVIYILSGSDIRYYDDRLKQFVYKSVNMPAMIEAFKGNLK